MREVKRHIHIWTAYLKYCRIVRKVVVFAAKLERLKGGAPAHYAAVYHVQKIDQLMIHAATEISFLEFLIMQRRREAGNNLAYYARVHMGG